MANHGSITGASLTRALDAAELEAACYLRCCRACPCAAYDSEQTANPSQRPDPMTAVLGCIADDFTGGTDLAETLSRNGMRTIQLLGVPDTARWRKPRTSRRAGQP